MAQAFRKSSLKGRHLGIQRILTCSCQFKGSLGGVCKGQVPLLCNVGIKSSDTGHQTKTQFYFLFFFILPYMIFSLYPGQISGVAAGLYANLYVPRDK